MRNIAILASGSGTNAENIYRFFSRGNRVRIPLLIYDRRKAGVAERFADISDTKTVYVGKDIWESAPGEIIEMLREEKIDLVVLAGFLRIIPREIIEAYPGRIINLHPALLPAYGGKGMYGMNVHKAVLEAGEKKSGATVHFVDENVDTGKIIMNQEVEIEPGETPESLAAKVHKAEYELFPRAIVAVLSQLPPMPETGAASEAASASEAGHVSESEAGNVSVEYAEAGSEERTVEIEEGKTGDLSANPPAIAGITPPPPSAKEWADALGMEYDPSKIVPAAEASGDAHGDGTTSPEVDAGERACGTPIRGGRIKNCVEEEMPPTYLAWSVVMTVLCCLPTGIAAIIFSSQVSSKFYAGDMKGAMKASERAQIWIIVSFVLGILANTLYLPIMLLFD